MNHGSLFSGIGGFELAAKWMGWNNIFNCEWEEFPRRVLRHHFPESKQYGDIKEFRATAYAGGIDILTGGFPCQPYSLAGQRKGKDDERHLWPEMLRIVQECAPRYVVGENVRGLVGWNGGLVFEEVCADLEAQGYDVQPFVLPACGVGAPHRRDRVWFVAHANHKGGGSRHRQVQGADEEVRQWDDGAQPRDSNIADVADTERVRLEHGAQPRGVGSVQGQVGRQPTCTAQANGGIRNAPDAMRTGKRQDNWDGKSRQPHKESTKPNWEDFPTISPVCGGDDGVPKQLDGITFSKWRRESIKAYGNAIVPQVAYQIFKAIDQYERLDR